MTPKEIIQLWPNQKAMADDIGVKEPTVAAWSRRDFIAAKHHFAVVMAARARGFELSFEDVASAHAAEAPGSTSEAA